MKKLIILMLVTLFSGLSAIAQDMVYGMSPRIYVFDKNTDKFVYDKTYSGIIKLVVDLDNDIISMYINNEKTNVIHTTGYKFYDNKDNLLSNKKLSKYLKKDKSNKISSMVIEGTDQDDIYYNIILYRTKQTIAIMIMDNKNALAIYYDKISEDEYNNEILSNY